MSDAAHDARRALTLVKDGAWDAAHELVQAHEGDPTCDRVHAYLHRAEGDDANARYWYRRAGEPVPSGSLDDERRAIEAALKPG